jgi:hypothetical protein
MPLQVTGQPTNRFSIDSNSSANTYVNITSNNLIDVANPALSRLLKKATNANGKHYGKMVIAIDSAEYNLIFSWIKAGANKNSEVR